LNKILISDPFTENFVKCKLIDHPVSAKTYDQAKSVCIERNRFEYLSQLQQQKDIFIEISIQLVQFNTMG